MAGKVAALALDPDGPPLSEKLNESAHAKYVSAMAQAGIPWQAFERFKPWMAGITLAISPLGKLGYEANRGAEKTLTATAKREGKAIGSRIGVVTGKSVYVRVARGAALIFDNTKID